MKKSNTIIAMLLLFMITACGNPEKNVSVRNLEIFGSIECEGIEKDIDEIISLEDGSYLFYIENDMLCVTLPFQKINYLPDGITLDSVNGMYVCTLDKDGNELKTSSGDEVKMKLSNQDDLRSLIAYGWNGNYKYLLFKFALLGENDLLEKINSFYIDVDVDFKAKETEIESTSDEAHSSSSSSLSRSDYSSSYYSGSDYSVSNKSKSNYSKVLDDYAKYVKKLKGVVKKALNGDLSAISEYADLLKETERLSNELSDLEGEMTAADLKKLEELNNELLDMSDLDFDVSDALQSVENLLDLF